MTSDALADYIRECRAGTHRFTPQEYRSIKNHEAYIRRITKDPTYYTRARRLERKAARERKQS